MATAKDWLVLAPWTVEEEDETEEEVEAEAAQGHGPTAGLQRDASAPVQVERGELETLLSEHRRLLADFADLRADFDILAGCVQEHGIPVAKRLQSAKASRAPASLEKVLAQPRLAVGVLAAAGQLAWALSQRASKSARRGAKAVQETKLIVCGGHEKHGDLVGLDHAEMFDFKRGQWEAAPKLPVKRVGHVGVAIGGCMYICGGLGVQARSVVYLSPKQWRWRPAAPTHRGRSWPAAIVMNNALYIIGGANGHDVETTIEYYQPNTGTQATNSWAMVRGSVGPRRIFAAATLPGNMALLCGGASSPYIGPQHTEVDFEPARTAEIFSFARGMSQKVASMQHSRVFHSALAMKGQVIAFGGSIPGTVRALRSAEIYNPSEDCWYECTFLSLRSPLGALCHEVAAGSLYLLGGFPKDEEGIAAVPSMQRVSLATGVWEDLRPMRYGRGSFVSGVIKCGPTPAKQALGSGRAA